MRARRMAAALLAASGPATPWEVATVARVRHDHALAQLPEWAGCGWLAPAWVGRLRCRRVYVVTVAGRLELTLLAADLVDV